MKYLLVLLASIAYGVAMAQKPADLKKYPLPGWKTDWAFHERGIVFNPRVAEYGRIKEALVDTKILTEAQLANALRLSDYSQYPDAMNSPEKIAKREMKVTFEYKSYWIGSWTEFFPNNKFFRQLQLLWVPKEENLHMPAGYVPKTDEGFYIVTRMELSGVAAPFQAKEKIATSVLNKLKSKKLPVAEKIAGLYDCMMPSYGAGMGNFYEVLKNNLGFTEDEIDAISRYTTEDNWPDSLHLTERKSQAYAKLNEWPYYKITEVRSENGLNELFWVAPGPIWEKGFEPKSKMGYFFAVRRDRTKGPPLLENQDLTYLNSPWWLKNISSEPYHPDTYQLPSPTYVANNNAGRASTSSSSNSNSAASSSGNGGFTVTTVNGITIARGNLERRNKRSGVFFIYWGTGGKVKHCTSFYSEFSASENELDIIKPYAHNHTDGTPYSSYSFLEGETCQSSRVKKIYNSLGCTGCGTY